MFMNFKARQEFSLIVPSESDIIPSLEAHIGNSEKLTDKRHSEENNGCVGRHAHDRELYFTIETCWQNRVTSWCQGEHHPDRTNQKIAQELGRQQQHLVQAHQLQTMKQVHLFKSMISQFTDTPEFPL